MLNDKLRAELDQSQATMVEVLPSTVKRLHEEFSKEFPEDKAWELTRIAVFAMVGGRGMLTQ